MLIFSGFQAVEISRIQLLTQPHVVHNCLEYNIILSIHVHVHAIRAHFGARDRISIALKASQYVFRYSSIELILYDVLECNTPDPVRHTCTCMYIHVQYTCNCCGLHIM